mgnify:CR=1 FL=1
MAKQDEIIQYNMIMSFQRMLEFYGLRLNEVENKIEKNNSFVGKKQGMVSCKKITTTYDWQGLLKVCDYLGWKHMQKCYWIF